MKIQRVCFVLQRRKNESQQTRAQMNEIHVHSITVESYEVSQR